MKYIINKPNLSKLEKKYVFETLSSTWLSSGGKNTKIFEEKFAKYSGNKFALAVQSGTSSLHLALKALGVTSKDYVIIPNFTCVSNISAASQCNAKIILVDIEKVRFLTLLMMHRISLAAATSWMSQKAINS